MSLPNLQFFTSAGLTITGLGFGTLNAGSESDVSEVYLWNNKGGAIVADTAAGVRISVLDVLNTKEERFVREGWVLARSSGITNPNTIANFFDDQQSVYTPITDTQDLLIGNIPNNCGRRISFKISVPVSAPTQAGMTIQVLGGHGGNAFPLPYFFNRAFGNGVVQEDFVQIFPVINMILGGTYNFVAIVGGAYTGSANKDFLVNIVSGGTPGAATYRSSDNAGFSYSSTFATATNGFTNVFTSAGLDEGVDIAWLDGGNGVRLATNDTFKIHVDHRPFQFIPGATNTLFGYVGGGNALVFNNRINKQQPSSIIVTANTRTFVYLTAAGDFATSTSRNEPQTDRMWMGWFDATSVITGGCSTWPYVALGLDAYDDFTPIWSNMAGLSWSYFQGKFKKFNRTVFLPAQDTFIGNLTLTAGVTNHIQIDPINEQVVKVSNTYLPDHIPLFRVKTGTNYIESWIDDRTRVGLVAPSLNRVVALTPSTVGTGLTVTFDFTNFANRALIRNLLVSLSAGGTGYTVSFYRRDTKLSVDTEYQAGTLPNPFLDDFLWYHEDLDLTNELHGAIENQTGTTQTFTLDLTMEQFA